MMMKQFKQILLTVIVAMVTTTAAFGQITEVATLSHNGELTSFYGVDALKEAYKAAVGGDVITLSSGVFNATNLGRSKSLTIRGAGHNINAEDNRERTIINSGFNFGDEDQDKDDDDYVDYGTPTYHFEGLCINGRVYPTSCHATFLKCSIGGFDHGYSRSNAYVQIIQSKVRDYCSLGGSANYYKFINSAITCYVNAANAEFHNCVLYGNYGVTWSSFTDCIFVSTNKDFKFDESNNATNCVACGENVSKKYWENLEVSNTTNAVISDLSIFKTFKGTVQLGTEYDLTADAQKKYPNLGMYAGSMPYSTTPGNPQITKFEVAPQTTEDGTLKVDIQVSPAK